VKAFINWSTGSIGSGTF